MMNTDGITPNVNPLLDDYRFSFTYSDVPSPLWYSVGLWHSVAARTMTGRAMLYADELIPSNLSDTLCLSCRTGRHTGFGHEARRIGNRGRCKCLCRFAVFSYEEG